MKVPPRLAPGGGLIVSPALLHVLRCLEHRVLPRSAPPPHISWRRFSAITTPVSGRKASVMGGGMDPHQQPVKLSPTCAGKSRGPQIPSRFTSTAHAVLEEPAAPLPHNLPASRSIPPAESSSNPRPLDFVPWWAQLPDRLVADLDSPTVTPSSFRHEIDKRFHPRQLASISTLQRLIQVYLAARLGETEAATPSDWAWLSGQLGHMLEEVDVADDAQKGVSALGHALRGLALARLAQTAEASDELDRAGEQYWAITTTIRSILALTSFRLGDRDGAFDQMSQAIQASFDVKTSEEDEDGRIGSHQTDGVVWSSYAREVIRAQRDLDLVNIARLCGARLLTRLAYVNPEHPTVLPFLDLTRRALRSITHPILYMQETGTTVDGSSDSLFVIALLGSRLHAGVPFDAFEAVELIDRYGLTGHLMYSMSLSVAKTIRAEGRSDLQKRFLGILEERLDRTIPRKILIEALKHFAEEGLYDDADHVWEKLVKHCKVDDYDRFREIDAALNRGDHAVAHRLIDQRWPEGQLISIGQATEFAVSQAFDSNDLLCAEKIILLLAKSQPQHQMVKSAINRLIRAYTRQGQSAALSRTVNNLEQLHFPPDIMVLTTMVIAFTDVGDFYRARSTFSDLLEAFPEADARAWSARLNVEIENGEWPGIAAVWRAIPKQFKGDRGVVVTIMKAFVILGSRPDDVVRLAELIDTSDSHAWSNVLQSLSNFSSPEEVERWHRRLIEQEGTSAGPNHFSYSILIHSYLRAGNLERGRAIFEEMIVRGVQPSSVTHSMIISSYISAAEDSDQQMDQALAFAEHCYDVASTSNADQLRRPRGTWADHIFGPLVTHAGSQGDAEAAQRFFDVAAEHEPPTIIMRTKLLDAYRRAGKTDLVLSVWKAIFDAAPRVVGSNVICVPLSITLDALASSNRYNDLRRIWKEVRLARFGVDSQNYNHLAVAMARTGDLDRAFGVVEKILLPRRREFVRRLKTPEPASFVSQPAPTGDEIHADDPHEASLDLLMDLETDTANRPDTLPDRMRSSLQVRSIVDTMIARETEKNARPASSFGLAFMSTNTRHSPTSTVFDGNASADINRINVPGIQHQDWLWRASSSTLACLASAVEQLEAAGRPRTWMALPVTSEEEEDVEQEQVVPLPEFGEGVCLREGDGKPSKRTAFAMLIRLGKWHRNTSNLIAFWRKKHRASGRGLGGGRSSR